MGDGTGCPAKPPQCGKIHRFEINRTGSEQSRARWLRRRRRCVAKTEAYLAGAEKLKQSIDPLSAAEIEALIRRAYAAPKQIVARAAVYAASSD